ncbi:MAG: hypothetical protein KAJ19_25870 [Gammaproteobacteria bacterium]|nr:hypothetical protein [Gammaproteobacteria bacterium]
MANQLPKLSWDATAMTIRTLIRSIENREYDINPTHQRNVVHTQDWKEELITSIFEVGSIPETWWHPVTDEKSREYFESVDGKQRISTILDFVHNKIKWQGKLFNQLDQTTQNKFLSHQLSMRVANRALTSYELSRLFEKLQQYKSTTLGERIHACRFPLIEQLEDLIQRHGPLLKKMKLGCNRHQQLEAYGKSLDYWIRNGESEEALSPTVMATIDNHDQGLDSRQLAQYEDLIKNTWETFLAPHLANVPRQMQSSTWLPIFALLYETRAEDVEPLKLYLNKNLPNIVSAPETWPKVGGNHNALVIRKETLKGLFEHSLPLT